MKITDENMAKWFPANRRFLHFCAKYYGLSFRNSDVVDEANFIAIKNVMSMKRREIEFDDEKHMVGTVMSTFRFAMLNAFKIMLKGDRLDIRNESEVTYSSGASDDEYNLYIAKAVAHENPYDNTMEIVNDIMRDELDTLESDCVRLFYLKELTIAEVCIELDVDRRQVRNAISRGLRKLKKHTNEEDYRTIEEEIKQRDREQAVRVVPKIVRNRPLVTNKAKDGSHTEAMSFLYS